jgi:hypothetical protein
MNESRIDPAGFLELLDRLGRETCEIESNPNPKGGTFWSVQIFPADTGVCLAYADSFVEAGWKALAELDQKRATGRLPFPAATSAPR